MSDDLFDVSGKAEVVLPAVLDLTAAQALKTSLLNAASVGPVVEVDADAVQKITTPAFQVLAAAAKSLAEKGGKLHFVHVPEAFLGTADYIGLSGLLGLEGA